MGQESIKLELIQWLVNLEDDETIDYLKVVKDSNDTQKDWWHDLTDEQKSGIARGLVLTVVLFYVIHAVTGNGEIGLDVWSFR